MKRARVWLSIVVVGATCHPFPGSAQVPARPVTAAVSQPTIEADPNPVPDGPALRSTTITWTTGVAASGAVYVSTNGGPETLFARGSAGSSIANWIDGASAYEFRLYSETTPRVLLATVRVQAKAGQPAPTPIDAAAKTPRGRPVLDARPNPVPAGAGLGTTQLTWDVGDGSTGRVLLSENGAEPKLFATGPHGTARADWIRAGSTYEFRLFGDAAADVPIASTTVTRRSLSSLSLVGLSLVVLLIAFVLVPRLYAKRRKRAGTKPRPVGPEEQPAWRLELSMTLAVAICLWAKLMYSGRLMADIPRSDRLIGSASLATILLLLGPLVLLPRIWRFVAIFLMDVLVSGVLLADELYFRRYLDIITTADLSSAPVLLEDFARPVVVGLLRPIDLVYGLDLAAVLLVSIFCVWAGQRRDSMSFRLRSRIAACALTIGVLAAVPATRLLWGKRFVAGNQSYRGEIAGILGLLPYHLYEATAHLSVPREPEPDLPRIRQFLAARRQTVSRSSLFGVAKRKNLILIQAESLQGFPIGLTVNEQAVTPHLDAFASESLQFVNFFDQTHHGFTSDGEFTALSSLHPLPEGSASVTLRTNHYRSLPAVLSSQGYATLSACAADSRVWSMAMMHPNHGFELSVFEDRFEDRERFQLISDGEFFSQMRSRLNTQPRPFMSFLITSSNHGPPFDIPERYRTLRLPGELSTSVLGDYLQSVHYFDRVFGEFVEGLRTSGLLDETVVAIYGDHQAYLGLPKEITALAGFADQSAYHRWLVEKRIPLLIRLPHGEQAGRRETPTGHLDIAPTLLGLLGVDDDDRVMFGRDATSGTPPLVVFRDGGFADGDYYYTLPRLLAGQPICYQASSGRKLDCAQLETGHRRALDQLAISDVVLRRDLVPALASAPIPKTVNDLPSPQPFSPEFGVDRVVISAFDVLAPAPSGATFSVENGGGPVRVLFAPIIDQGARGTEADGVIFEVWSGGSRLYQKHVLPAHLEAAAVDVPPVPGQNRTEISFVTKTPADGSPGRHRATWQRVRFLTGSTARTSSTNRPSNGV